ncbi:MAG: PIG-L family deacetylase [Acidimicrobiaceae bacterium]|nr:PIG-L family deacetylase [Acidimicrobiaceae bacterium]
MRVFKDVPLRVLAIYAHPDDAEISCGGTIATWAKANSTIRLVVCTLGDKGAHNRSSLSTSDKIKLRAEEADRSARRMGVKELVALGYPDGEVGNDRELREKLVAQIRDHRPDVLLCPDPTTIFFGSGFFNHRDHREIGMACLDAAFPAARLDGYFPDSLPAHSVQMALLSATNTPDVIVDIASGLNEKIEAVAMHSSQVEYGELWLGQALSNRAEEAARGSKFRYAESFRMVQGGG